MSVRSSLLLLALAAGLGLWGCAEGGKSAEPAVSLTKLGPRLYRGDLDGRKGLLFYAAGDTSLTVAYDTALGGLYAAWKAPMTGTAPEGPALHRQAAARLWTVRNGADTLDAVFRFLGYRDEGGGITIFRYALDLPGGKTLSVEEAPYFEDHYADVSLLREFRFQGLDSGMTVGVRLGCEGGAFREEWYPSAPGKVTGEPGKEVLEMTGDGASTVKLVWIGSGAS